jgi:hypothetical protein
MTPRAKQSNRRPTEGKGEIILSVPGEDGKPVHLRRGEVGRLEVLHDSWCPMLKGTGDCTCEPEYKLNVLPRRGGIMAL